ncbi:response regulator [Bosea caraganae]|uniref:Response regulator n=1 Tax=Bosea caraganae TaxID=2763117 RepID=A0A370L9D8_9HYPH|nr:response regulator [Bosea caraganae]RDJ26993.1 response regulator [Bosea caraganae]RDJ30878.1 response regulator [Bosea caraganae]
MPGNALIAVVDDDASARDALVDLVRAMGFGAAGFRSAPDFLGSKLLPQSDCVIVDMRMPGMGGIELYAHLCASGIAIPTVLVTAYPDEATRKHAREIGIGFYLSKPCDPDELLHCLAQLRSR